ncbi:MAG: hypothetical protein V3S43_06490 [Acidimicrobiia bacterium]
MMNNVNVKEKAPVKKKPPTLESLETSVEALQRSIEKQKSIEQSIEILQRHREEDQESATNMRIESARLDRIIENHRVDYESDVRRRSVERDRRWKAIRERVQLLEIAMAWVKGRVRELLGQPPSKS